MIFILTLTAFFIIIGLLVFVHEFGHFAAAKLSGVPVNEFAIGFGPTLLGKEYKGTLYQLKLIPLGGFVSLEGEEDTNDPNGFRNQPYRNKLLILFGGVIMNVITAILLLGIFVGINNRKLVLPALSDHEFGNLENVTEYYPVGIAGISESFEWSGLEPGDTLVSLNETQFSSMDQFAEYILESAGETQTATILDLQSGELLEKDVTIGTLYKNEYFVLTITNFLDDSRTEDQLEIGQNIVSIEGQSFKNFGEFQELLNDNAGKEDVSIRLLDFESGDIEELLVDLPEPREESGTVLDASLGQNYGINFVELFDTTDNIFNRYELKGNILVPFTLTWDLLVYQVDGLVNIIGDSFETGDYSTVSQSFGGPVAVGSSVREIILVGNIAFLIFLAALISLSLAIFNVLPIPALDGGQVMIVTLEKIRRKPFSEETVKKINFTGFFFLILLSVVILIKDVIQFGVFSGFVDTISSALGR